MTVSPFLSRFPETGAVGESKWKPALTNMSKRVKHRNQEKERPKDDPRFQQLLAAASEGDENAIADLWREFGFRFGEDQP